MVRRLALGTLIGLLLAAAADAQMVSGSTRGSAVVPRPSTQPPIRFATPAPPPRRFDRDFGRDWVIPRGRFRSHEPRSSCRYSWSGCAPLVRSGVWITTPYVTQTVVPYAVPYYVPVPIPSVAPAPAPPAKPYDPTKSRMMTIGGGADGGGGVMRIEPVNDSIIRLTWLGTARPVREARLYLADSAQRPLRSALVDSSTASALFKTSDLRSRLVYYGLTVHFSNGAIETTLVPVTKAQADVR